MTRSDSTGDPRREDAGRPLTKQHNAAVTGADGPEPAREAGVPPMTMFRWGAYVSLGALAILCAAAAGFPVPLPNAAAARQGRSMQAWVNSGRRQVALVFDNGKVTIMMWPATYKDPASEFRAFMAQNNASAAMSQVNGRPALVIEPNTDVRHSNPAWVEFDRNGIDINVVSYSYGTDLLSTGVRHYGSMRPSKR